MKKVLMTAAALAAFTVPAMATDWTGNYVGGSVNTGFNTAGVFVGSNYDLGPVVVGVEAGGNHNASTGVNDVTLEGVLGYDAGVFMPYVTGGWTITGSQVYGAGVNYQTKYKAVLGAKWTNTGGSNKLTGRVGFNF